MRIILLLAGITAAVAISVGPAEGDNTGGTPVSPSAIEKARQFKKYRLFWLGSGSYRGDNLTAVLTGNPPNFIYGDCQLPPGQDEGGCAPPYEIQNWSVCERNLHDAGGVRREGHLKRVKGPRGAITFQFEPGGLEVYTGRTNVVVFAPSRKLALLAARSVRPLSREHSVTRLPRPAPGALQGDLSCRR